MAHIKPINELCEFVSPAEWKDWLNEIQAALLRSDQVEGYTREARQELADNFLYLQRFFSGLQNQSERLNVGK